MPRHDSTTLVPVTVGFGKAHRRDSDSTGYHASNHCYVPMLTVYTSGWHSDVEFAVSARSVGRWLQLVP